MQERFVRMLESTSRTFLIPILGLPSPLRDAVCQAYLCLRGIDEIEDHPELAASTKAELLLGVAAVLQANRLSPDYAALDSLLKPYSDCLPEVSLALPELVGMGPKDTGLSIRMSTAEMARSMADWATLQWRIQTEEDLDQYTFDVAGRVGLLLSVLWRWHDGTESNDQQAVGFGRALQTVNIIRNRNDDLGRGVDFFPDGWNQPKMIVYARRQIGLAEAYMQALKKGAVRDFCSIPLALARATLTTIEAGREKLTRDEVGEVVRRLTMREGNGK
jgi:farnesyl-diphosphate farnesyltransferase